jgi:hypothetical protein
MTDMVAEVTVVVAVGSITEIIMVMAIIANRDMVSPDGQPGGPDKSAVTEHGETVTW